MQKVKTFDTYKDSGIEWIGEIPNTWHVLPHKHIMRKVKNVCERYNGENIISLTMKGVIKRDLDNPTGKMPLTFDGYQRVEEGNLLLCLFDIDVTPRCVGVIKDNGLTSPAYSQFKLLSNDNISYYDYLLRAIDDDKCFLHLSKNLRNSLTEENFGAILTIRPSIQEQQQIADYLDKKCGEIDRVVETQKDIIEKLKEYKQSVITEAVTKGLDKSGPLKDSGIEWIGKIPKSWEVYKIKHCVIFNPTYSENLEENTPVSFAPMECLTNCNLDCKETTIEKVSGSYTYFAEEDIIMAKVTPCFENGNIAIAKNLLSHVGFGTSELYVFRAKNINNKFLLYFLQNRKFKDLAISTMYGTGGLKRVSADFVKNYKFGLPTANEQKQIAEYLDKKCSEIDSAISDKELLIEKLTEYKKSLIYECVTGKRKVVA